MLKTWTKVVDSRSNWVLRGEQIAWNKTLSIDYKQRPFRFDESCRNWESRRNNQESSLDSCKDGEFSVNLLLNSTVNVLTDIIAVDLKMAVDDLWVEKWIVTKMQNVMCKKSFNTVSTVPSAIRCETSSSVVHLTSFSL